MKKTKTYSFGVGKRESHDSSPFYKRSLFDGMHIGVFEQEVSKKELKSLEISPVGKWVDKIYCQSSERMDVIPDDSIALAFTSPPYNVGKEYDADVGLREYLDLIEKVGKEVYRVLRSGGRYVINIANLGRKPYIPLHALFYDVHLRLGFLPMGEIIWQKGEGATGNVAWGSWRSAKAPRLRDVHEYLLVFAKKAFHRPDTGLSNISTTDFMDATLSIWKIPPESAQRVRHPAPFPVELAERVIGLYSYVDDVVLDPFLGSGTTCVAAANKGRHYVGFDISQEYCAIALERVRAKGKLYMPSERTEASELSVAFGLLGIRDPIGLSDQAIEEYFEGTLTPEKYVRFQQEFQNQTNAKLYAHLLSVGAKLRINYSLFSNVAKLRWNGPERQARTSSGAQDLLVSNISVSVKAESDIVSNPSPSNIFENIPQGKVPAERSENWYLIIDSEGLQKLYDAVRNVRIYQFREFPPLVNEFEENAKKRDRTELQSEIRKLSREQETLFNERYIEMCRTVSIASAETFNNNFRASMQTSSRNSVIEHIVKYIFRLESVEYVLTGISKKKEFAVRIPALKEWKREWEIVDIKAEPDLAKKQSRVMIIVTYRNKITKLVYIAHFHVEIRWSHGKFCGAPEAKLYKDFKWSDIAFVTSIL